MTFREAEDWLLGLEQFGMRFGLDRMRRLMTVLGMPQHRFASIHVVGTNGKSSTTRMTAAILERHGVRTGSYTSPHLRSFAERIEVGGVPVPEWDFGEAAGRAHEAVQILERTLDGQERVTQFEALTAAAYHELARRGVEVAVVEAGLGGRLDATNVIPSRVQVLTGVALEHTRWLGSTVTEIAEEKLAVVRDHGCLVVPALEPEVEAVARRVAAERHARLVVAPEATPEGEGLKGAFQRRNFALARTAAHSFLDHPHSDLTREAAAGLRIPGRLERMREDPLVLYDAAHNPAGARALAEALPEVTGGRPLVGVFGVLDDKDATGMLAELLPLCRSAVYTQPAHPRALSPGALEALGGESGVPCETAADPAAAIERAVALAGPQGAVIATGSIYLMADLLRDPGAPRASVL